MRQALSSRRRVLEALRHREPDRVPVFITLTPQLAEALCRSLGLPSRPAADSPLSANRVSFTELLVELGNDIVGIGACAPSAGAAQELRPGLYLDEWGITCRSIGHYREMVGHPLAEAESMSDIAGYRFPEPGAPGRFSLADQVVTRYGDSHAVCGDLECTIFEGAWHLTGFDKFVLDLALDRQYVFALMEGMMEYSIGVGRALIDRGADLLWLGDDVGTQRGMLISPDMWRGVLKERLRRVIRALKDRNPGVKIAYHSCGSYFPIIPDLLEIGVDVLNALQPMALDMDLGRLKSLFGDRACLFGGLDIQRVLPFGTMEEVEAELRRVIAAAGPGGGYILAGAHNLQPDTSPEKVTALFRLARDLGRYPLAGAAAGC